MKVLFFAALKEALGTAELECSTSPGLTLGELRQQLMARSPQWQEAFTRYAQMGAVDHALASDDTPLEQAQEVAFFPMVTGG